MENVRNKIKKNNNKKIILMSLKIGFIIWAKHVLFMNWFIYKKIRKKILIALNK